MRIQLKVGQRLYFTSDTHYNHTNICTATTNWRNPDGSIPYDLTRDFKDLDSMNARLVAGINSVLRENDILIHLGDWSFGGFEQIEIFRTQIICKNIHLVLGNHDHHIERNKNNVRSLFSSVNQYIELEVLIPSLEHSNPPHFIKHRFILMHYPIASWHNMNQGVIHLHGHVHLPNNKRISAGKAMDVGVDGNGYDPISLEEIIKIMSKQPIAKLSLPTDHHEKRVTNNN